MRSTLAFLALSFWTSAAMAQGAPTVDPTHAIVVLPAKVVWAPAPPILPPGAKAAVLEGDPTQAGPFTMRVSFPDGYRLAPHFHPVDERVTVIKGTFQLGMGDKFDAAALNSLPAGAYVSMRSGTRHFAQAKGATIVQINGEGPWKLTYVNPADDPQKSTP
jgi:quercetin dioxygenase-like cupin family protein